MSERPSSRLRRGTPRGRYVHILASRRTAAFHKGIPWDEAAMRAYAVERAPVTCEATGIPFDFSVGRGLNHRFFSPSLDRIVPARGYVAGNVAIVIWGLNCAKQDMDLNELELMALLWPRVVAFYRKREEMLRAHP